MGNSVRAPRKAHDAQVSPLWRLLPFPGLRRKALQKLPAYQTSPSEGGGTVSVFLTRAKQKRSAFFHRLRLLHKLTLEMRIADIRDPKIFQRLVRKLMSTALSTKLLLTREDILVHILVDHLTMAEQRPFDKSRLRLMQENKCCGRRNIHTRLLDRQFSA